MDYGRRTPAVTHPFGHGIAITYAPAPAPDQAVGWADLAPLGLDERALRRRAFDNLDAMLGTVRLHGSPPAVLVSFHGIESSLLLADGFWSEHALDLPDEPVVAVPARDVLVVTGSGSAAGIAKARRCVERVYFAGSHHHLVPDLLIRRGNGWQRYDEDAETYQRVPAESERWSPPEDRTIAPRRERYA
jgi:hypothetical protein